MLQKKTLNFGIYGYIGPPAFISGYASRGEVAYVTEGMFTRHTNIGGGVAILVDNTPLTGDLIAATCTVDGRSADAIALLLVDPGGNGYQFTNFGGQIICWASAGYNRAALLASINVGIPNTGQVELWASRNASNGLILVGTAPTVGAVRTPYLILVHANANTDWRAGIAAPWAGFATSLSSEYTTQAPPPRAV